MTCMPLLLYYNLQITDMITLNYHFDDIGWENIMYFNTCCYQSYRQKSAVKLNKILLFSGLLLHTEIMILKYAKMVEKLGQNDFIVL